MDLTKMLSGIVQSSAKSLLSSGLKKTAKDLFKKSFQKSDEQVKQEIINDIGYLTQHYKLDKDRNIVYKSSPVFFHEWLTKNPLIAGKIIKDDESNKIYFENDLLSNQNKVAIIETFVNDTGVNSAATSSHFDAAIKLLDPSSYNSGRFNTKYSDPANWTLKNQSVIDSFMQNCFGECMETNPEYATMLFRKWIIGTAKRVITPGSSLDGCLTMTGPAGVGKTRFFRELLPERTGEIICNIKNPQKFVEAIVGKTISCFDELSVLEHPASQETFKQLLSSQAIDVRLPWRRDPQRFSLRCGFGATTNKTKFIPDQFFSRRLWTIELNDKGRLNFDYLYANRDALWTEAVFYAKKEEKVYLSQEEQKLVEENNTKYLKETKDPVPVI